MKSMNEKKEESPMVPRSHSAIKVLLALFICFQSSVMLAQNHTTMGTDFWISYLYFTYDYYAPQYQVTLHAFASGPRECTVTMTNPNTSWSTSFRVRPGQVTFVDVPYDDGCTSLSGQVTHTAIHITSTDTISLYLITLGHNNIDMTNVLPTPSLGSNYMVQCYPSKLTTDYRSELVVVAAEDNTVVDIVPSANTMNGFVAGSTYTVNLSQGDAYQLRGANNAGEADLTGTRITARDCKKIAVFSGHFCAYVPNSPTTSTCDHIYDQSYPIPYWGRQFAVAGTGTAFDDPVRVMALEDSCRVYKDGIHVTTLNSGDVYDFTLSTTRRTAYIETSTPASVYMFLGSAGSSNGDPSMIIINPIDQRVQDITFATYSTTYTNTHYVTIVAEDDEMQQIMFDNSPVTSQPFAGNSSYRYASMQISAGSHRIRTLGTKGFNAYAFGIGLHESYGYSVGSSLNVIDNIELYANETLVYPDDTLVLCAGSDVTFHVATDSGRLLCEWSIDSTLIGVFDELPWHFTDTGWFYLQVVSDSIHFVECYTPTTTDNEIGLMIRVLPNYLVHYSDTIFASQLPWVFMGKQYEEAITYDTIHTTSMSGCDSVIVYSLMVKDWQYEDYYDTVCAGSPYVGYGFDLTSEETGKIGSFDYTYSNDSAIVTLHLMQVSAPPVSIDYEIIGDSCYVLMCFTEADSIRWSADPQDPSFEGLENYWTITVCPKETTIYSVEALYGYAPECATSKSISLNPRIPFGNNVEIWVPNTFTPQLSTNSLFRAYGVGISDFEMYVFQRWGFPVFHTHDMEEGWDGTWGDKLCPEGTYVYVILYRSVEAPAQLNRLYGTVTLIR